MAYEARRDDSFDDERARADANNAKNLRNAADVAVASGEAHAVAIGGAVKAADKITGGKSTEVLGKGLTNAQRVVPGGRMMQNASNKFAESGASDAVGKAASMYNGMQGNGGPNTPNQVKTNANDNPVGGEQNSSLPSSGSNKNTPPTQNNGASDESSSDARKTTDKMPKNDTKEPDNDDKEQKDEKAKNNIFSNFSMSTTTKVILFGALISSGFIVALILVGVVAAGIISNYEDAFGISATTDEDTGNIVFNAGTQEQQEFYNRIVDVKNSYQANGKTVDTLKIVAVYNTLSTNGAAVSYSNMDDAAIKDIADCMFDGNSYSEETFKNNLKTYLFPKYLPNSTDDEREAMVDEVFDYIKNYYDLIGKNDSTTCSSGGSCTYDIKGFYIQGKGNVVKNIQVSDLYVRLMQCNGRYGGTAGLPLAGEELVPFETYILGVAYAEVGTSFHEEAIKAQMVAARSYALARPTEMGGWRTLKEEDGKWILQAAACTQDQVFCNPDKGCHSSNGQWSQVYSGESSGSAYSRGPLAADAPMRTYASETEGEVLTNAQDYIVYASFINTDQNRWNTLAKSGLNYKQILLQHYNQGNRNYGATDIKKASCGGSSTNCSTVTGEYASWKQYRGEWTDIKMGNSGKTVRQIGCLVTAISMQIARSGVSTNISGEFNPGTFVQYLNTHNGFVSGGNFVWAAATTAAPDFKYQDRIYMSGWSKQQKLNKIKELTSQSGVYVVAEVKGNTGQHWVALVSVNGDSVTMMDPGSESTDLWSEYNWVNTSQLVYYKVG